MNIQSLKAEQLEARKVRDSIRANLLGTIIAEATRNNKDPDSEQIFKSIRKIHTGVLDMLAHVPNSENATYELEILNSYLPRTLSAEDLNRALDSISIEMSMRNMKSIKEMLEISYPGQIDGKMLAEAVKSKIAA